MCEFILSHKSLSTQYTLLYNPGTPTQPMYTPSQYCPFIITITNYYKLLPSLSITIHPTYDYPTLHTTTNYYKLLPTLYITIHPYSPLFTLTQPMYTLCTPLHSPTYTYPALTHPYQALPTTTHITSITQTHSMDFIYTQKHIIYIHIYLYIKIYHYIY